MDTTTDTTFTPATTLEVIASLRSVLGQVMRIETHKIHVPPVEVIEFSGQLIRPSDEAFEYIYDRLIEVGYTPTLTQRDGKEVVIAQHGIVQPTPNNTKVNVILLALTIISTWLAGIIYAGGEQLARLVPPDGDFGAVLGSIFSHPGLWPVGLPYAFTLLGILGIHEMGHYVAARMHKAAVTLPFFIPLPPLGFFSLGTMGAVIRLKSPIKNRRQLFDIGVAGPLAGLVIAIPLLTIGLLTSPVQHVGVAVLGSQEGNSILYALLKFITKGQFLPSNGNDVIVNAIAFPAWFGLVVTMINLLPIGQLDGGHVIYSIFGHAQWRIAQAAIVVLLGLGFYLAFVYQQFINVWLLWVFIAQIFGLRHPPPLDDLTPLDAKRKLIGWATIAMFFLIFTPLPFS
jgi:Zn-dependent protease